MNSPHILIVDDETSVCFVLENSLKHQGYAIDIANNGSEAIQRLTQTSYDLVLLDLQMEPIDGLQVLNAAREQDPELVVIILTAYGSLESAVEALRLGAFDYLFKPANPQSIRQRVQEGLQQRRKTLQQRRVLAQIETLRQTLDALETTDTVAAPPAPQQRFIRSGPLVIDTHHRTVTFNDNMLELTTTEFDLLVCLVRDAPRPISPRKLVGCAMGYDCDETEAREIIKWHIYQLRQKIEPEKQPQYIKTVRHKGYLWSG